MDNNIRSMIYIIQKLIKQNKDLKVKIKNYDELKKEHQQLQKDFDCLLKKANNIINSNQLLFGQHYHNNIIKQFQETNVLLEEINKLNHYRLNYLELESKYYQLLNENKYLADQLKIKKNNSYINMSNVLFNYEGILTRSKLRKIKNNQ